MSIACSAISKKYPSKLSTKNCKPCAKRKFVDLVTVYQTLMMVFVVVLTAGVYLVQREWENILQSVFWVFCLRTSAIVVNLCDDVLLVLSRYVDDVCLKRALSRMLLTVLVEQHISIRQYWLSATSSRCSQFMTSSALNESDTLSVLSLFCSPVMLMLVDLVC